MDTSEPARVTGKYNHALFYHIFTVICGRVWKGYDFSLCPS